MFRTVPAADPQPEPVVGDPPAELVPLSHLELDLASPVEGWPAHLAQRGVEIVLDDLGRAVVARDDARRLFTERRELEARGRAMAAKAERAAIEADRQWRAQLAGGIPAYQIPDGVSVPAAMLQAARDAQPRRQSLLDEALSNSESLTFHSLAGGDEL